MTKEEAQKKIQELTAQALELVHQAEKVADEHELSFNFSVSYGMGGWYEGSKEPRGDYEDGWAASSHNC